MDSIVQNLNTILTKVSNFSQLYGSSGQKVELLAVSKTKPMQMIEKAYEAGQRHFGESYAVEASEKIAALKQKGYHDIIWHFIGPIQKNKTRLIAENFDIVESLDREIIAKRLNEQRPDEMGVLDVLIQVNISCESQKSGCSIEELPSLVDAVLSCRKLRLRGFMGVGLDTEDKDLIDAEFAQLKSLFENYRTKLEDFDILSIGMTNDMDIAIKNGSTEVRIGTAIFGAREYKNKSNVQMENKKIAFIGGGNMAGCIYDSIVKSFDAKDITVSGPHTEKLERFRNFGSVVTSSNIEALKDAQVVFLGVKPQILTDVLEEIAASGVNCEGKLFVSMAAGFKLSSISSKLNTKRIIRIMPNTPAKIGLGVIAVSYDEMVSDEDKALCKKMLSNMGLCIEGTEQQLNVIGAVCGCGPAFVFRFMEALVTEAVRHGISEADARTMVEQTVFGSASLVKSSPDSSIASLREAVTSKGGTTFAGLCKMTEGNFEKTMENTIQASLDRTYEFEKMF